jgi:Rod binding domain-containing protein
MELGTTVSKMHNAHLSGINQGPDLSVVNSIRGNGTQKEQLKKVATEFEAIFVTKMISTLDKTVDKEGSLFGSESKYMDTFKSLMFNDIGRQIANNPHSSIGLAKQIYQQMEKTVTD